MRMEESGPRNLVRDAVIGSVVQSGIIQGNVTIYQAGSVSLIPRQLPRTAARFVARADELAELDAIFRDSRGAGVPGLALVVGSGGVGKSMLAVVWGSCRAEEFPDGQLYVDMRGFSAGAALSTEQALGGFLRAFGVSADRVPVELAEQAAMFRSVTADRRVLVVVDNVLSAAQVRPLLPASEGSMVIVTTRLRLSGLRSVGGVLVEVNPLSIQQAVDLLSGFVGERRMRAEHVEVRELAALCGRLPIALQVVGTRLSARPRHRVARVVSELVDERQRLTRLSTDEEVSVHSIFDLSYQALPPEVACVYRLVSAHPGADFSAGVAAAAAGVAITEAEARLLTLVDASLLEEVDEDRYRFHDLVRLHALARAETHHEHVAAAVRIGKWFLHQVTRANLVVIPMRWRVSPVAAEHVGDSPAFPSGREALDWLDSELANVLAVLDNAADRGWNRLAWQLCEALWELFLHRKHYGQWITSHRVGIDAAVRCGDEIAESRLRCQLARAYLELRLFDDAERECLTAASLARRQGDRHNESVALDQLGMVAQGCGETDQALAWFEQSLAIERELGIARGVAQRHRRIGETLLGAGLDAEAAKHLREAHQMMADLSDSKDVAKIEISLARIEARAGRTTVARQSLARALVVLRESGSAAYQIDVLIALAEVGQDDGDLTAARGHLTEALALAREIGGPHFDRVQARLADLDSVQDVGAEPERPRQAD